MFRRGTGQTLLCSASPAICTTHEVLAAQHALGEGPALPAVAAPELQLTDNTSKPGHAAFFEVPASRAWPQISRASPWKSALKVSPKVPLR
jgi:hypothetical protein